MLTLDMYAVDERKVDESVQRMKEQQKELEAEIASLKDEVAVIEMERSDSERRHRKGRGITPSRRVERGNDKRAMEELREKELLKKDIEKKIKAIQEQLKELNLKIEKAQMAASNWKDNIRNSEFVVTVAGEIGSFDDGVEFEVKEGGNFK